MSEEDNSEPCPPTHVWVWVAGDVTGQADRTAQGVKTLNHPLVQPVLGEGAGLRSWYHSLTSPAAHSNIRLQKPGPSMQCFNGIQGLSAS